MKMTPFYICCCAIPSQVVDSVDLGQNGNFANKVSNFWIASICNGEKHSNESSGKGKKCFWEPILAAQDYRGNLSMS